MTRTRQPPRAVPASPHDRTAQTLGAKAAWNDLVLPAAVVAQLRHIAADMAARSLAEWKIQDKRSVSALFTGPRGTGKTLAAQVLAHELKLDLYRVDLAAVVSQYIGETEKNLGQVFDAAAGGGILLFFDEADALFGKRSEVKDAHDRYANQEISYLLQRIEAHPGLVILATNRKAALDTAFIRHLRHVVDFPSPGVAERKQFWARMFPVEVRAGQLDVERLARFPLTGGSIRAIALDAGLHAAQRGSAVTPALVFEAVRRALEELGQPISEEDLC